MLKENSQFAQNIRCSQLKPVVWYIVYFVCLSTTGAAELPAAQFDGDLGPLFLSSLHCTDDDQSLLEDCAHDRLGLASCDETSGLAVARCSGTDYSCYTHHYR